MSATTYKAYARTWALFQEFANYIQLPGDHRKLPLSTGTTALFVAFLYNKGMAASSIKSHLSSVSYSHRMLALPSPSDSFLISKVLKGAAAEATGDARYPITLPVLQSLLQVLPSLAHSLYEKYLFFAMFTVAFHGFLRCGEMCASQHCLQYSQISVAAGNSVHITFTNFKHSKPGQPFIIKLQSKPNQLHCPVAALSSYLYQRGSRPEPLFCMRDNTPIPRAKFSKQLQACLKCLKLPVDNYKAHSFRIGAASHALLQGKTESEIQFMGRWSSNGFRKYFRLSAAESI